MMDAKVCKTGSPRSETDVGRGVVREGIRAGTWYEWVGEIGRSPIRCDADGMGRMMDTRGLAEARRWSQGSKDTAKSRIYIPDLDGSRQPYKSRYSTQFDTYEGAHGGQELALHGLALGEAAADLNEERLSVGGFS